MFPSIASVAAIGAGVVNVTANILHIKSSLDFNFKRLPATTLKSITSLTDVFTVAEKVEFFIQLLEHLLEVLKDSKN